MGYICCGDCAVIEHRHGAMQTDVYKSRLEMVLGEIRDSSHFCGGCWASDEHLAALEHVLQVAQEVKEQVLREREEEGSS